MAHLSLNDAYDLGREFLRGEMATAVAGSILGINPFNQPDVEAAKTAARALTDRYAEEGTLPEPEPLAETGGPSPLRLYVGNAEDPSPKDQGQAMAFEDHLAQHLDHLEPGSYPALLAFLPETRQIQGLLADIRDQVRSHKGVATCLGFDPRYLHPTGQLHKGGLGKGVFLVLTAGGFREVPVPGWGIDLGTVSRAQALGDLQVLAERGQRALRVDLSDDPEAGLARLAEAVRSVLA